MKKTFFKNDCDTKPHEHDDILYEGHDLEALAFMPNYYSWIVETFRPRLRGHVMEIGTGIGTIADKILPDVEKLDLVEPSKNLSKFLSPSLKNSPKVTVFSEDLETRLPKIADVKFDAIVMVNVLEHVENDGVALKQLRRVLKPGGHLLLFVPALQFLFSRLDYMHGHFRRYEKKPLEKLIQENGLDVQFSRYFDLAGIIPWWLMNTILGNTKFSPNVTKIYDTYIIPVTRFAERILPPPIGKNIILIARRI